MALPSNFYDDDVNYRIRLCMLVSEALAVAKGSKINPCDSCDALIWVAESQVIPPLPDGMTVDGDVNVCRHCAAEIFKQSGVETPDFIDNQPPEVVDEVKKFFGLTPP